LPATSVAAIFGIGPVGHAAELVALGEGRIGDAIQGGLVGDGRAPGAIGVWQGIDEVNEGRRHLVESSSSWGVELRRRFGREMGTRRRGTGDGSTTVSDQGGLLLQRVDGFGTKVFFFDFGLGNSHVVGCVWSGALQCG
jgi:hypothetical protein